MPKIMKTSNKRSTKLMTYSIQCIRKDIFKIYTYHIERDSGVRYSFSTVILNGAIDVDLFSRHEARARY